MARYWESTNAQQPEKVQNTGDQMGFWHLGENNIALPGVTATLKAFNATTLSYQDVTIDDATGGVIVSGGAGGGAGQLYTEGDVDATITGRAAMWEDAGDTLRPVSAATPFPVNIVTPTAVPVTDNAGSLTVDGSVTADTELPAAAALGDTDANPTTPLVGASGMVWNGSTWTRARGGTGDGAGATGFQNVLPMLFNGATHDRFRGDTTNGLDVDVTRVTGTVTVDTELPAAAALADNTANPTVPAVGAFLVGFDGTNWDRVRADGGALFIQDGGNSITVDGTVGVSGSVDTELPAAAALADNTANPTVPATGAFLMGYDGTNWDRVRADGGSMFIQDGGNSITVDGTVGVSGSVDTELPAAAALADNTANPTVPAVGGFLMGFDGTNWDRVRADSGSVYVQGPIAHDTAVGGNPLLTGFEARTTDGTAVTSGDAVRGLADTLGKQVVLVGSVHDLHVDGKLNEADNTADDIIAAVASTRIVVTGVSVMNASTTTDTKVEIRDGTTVKIQGFAGKNGGGFTLGGVGPLFIGTANTAVTGRCVTTGADVDFFVTGYKIAN